MSWNMPSKLKAQVEKKGREFVFTKDEMAKNLIDNHTNIREGDRVMNSSYGDGAFYENLPDYCEKYYCEIEEGIDYLQDGREVDLTIDNPPFVPRSLFWKFMQRAMRNTTREIYWLINLASLNVFTPKRLNEMKDKGWYINNFHIVADRRWYGRYVWLKITKEDTGIFTWENNPY